MSVLSRFTNPKIRQIYNLCRQQVRHGGGGRKIPFTPESIWEHQMNIHPSQWPRWQMMNAVMFWCAVWGIPAFGIAFYNYLFNGEAVLKAIPEGYEPREEEYERHPITRWYITSGISESEQQRLEENMYINWENVNNAQRAQLIMEVKRVMSQDGDYAGFDWTPFSAHRVRLMNKNREELFTVAGHDNMN